MANECRIHVAIDVRSSVLNFALQEWLYKMLAITIGIPALERIVSRTRCLPRCHRT